MQITLPAKGKEGNKNYRPKKLYSLSNQQRAALECEYFADLEQAQAELGKQATMILKSLVALELFKQKKDASYDRTRLGAELNQALSQRV